MASIAARSATALLGDPAFLQRVVAIGEHLQRLDQTFGMPDHPAGRRVGDPVRAARVDPADHDRDVVARSDQLRNQPQLLVDRGDVVEVRPHPLRTDIRAPLPGDVCGWEHDHDPGTAQRQEGLDVAARECVEQALDQRLWRKCSVVGRRGHRSSKAVRG
jgi:hypothetical protein